MVAATQQPNIIVKGHSLKLNIGANIFSNLTELYTTKTNSSNKLMEQKRNATIKYLVATRFHTNTLSLMRSIVLIAASIANVPRLYGAIFN